MARIRTVKPEVAKHELLFELEQELKAPVRFAWVMLPAHCDREGRFKWRPKSLKTDILPYDEIEFSRVLDAWLTRGLLVRYRVDDEWYGWVPTFRKHQAVNPRESASQLPSLEDADEVIDNRNQRHADASSTRDGRDEDALGARATLARGEGKGREGNTLRRVDDASTVREPGAEGSFPERSDASDEAWRRDVPECDPQAHETWLAYREEAGDRVRAHQRLMNARFLARKGTAEQQRAFVEKIIRLGFKRMADPAWGGTGDQPTAKEGKTHAGLPIINP